MSRSYLTPSTRISLAALLLTLSAGALAAPPPRMPQDRIDPNLGPVVACAIDPAPPAGPNEFQATTVTLTLKSGTPRAGTKIEVRLGTLKTGTPLATACTDGFGRDAKIVISHVLISPHINDPNYAWKCNATLTSAACDVTSPPE